MMTTITRWVLTHRRLVTAFWILITLVGIATRLGPDDLATGARKLATLIDQDGPEPDDTDRARVEERFVAAILKPRVREQLY